MIAALTPDKPCALAFITGAMVGERDLERRVDRLRAGVAEEDVVEVAGKHAGEAVGEFERCRVAELEGWCVVELHRLLTDCFDDPRAAVAGVRAPQAGGRVEPL